jgi:hypothetical protein
MAQQDPQPEEAATRPAASAAQFAGNFTQTSMYGRALAGRGQTGGKDKDLGPGSDEQQPAAGRPARKSATGQGTAPPEPLPDNASTLELTDDPALRRLIEEWDPVEHATRLAAEPGQPWAPEPPAPVIEPGHWTFAFPDGEGTALTAGLDDGQQPGEPELEADDPQLACRELDSDAAQHRLQVGQVELPPIVMPGPAIGPGPV